MRQSDTKHAILWEGSDAVATQLETLFPTLGHSAQRSRGYKAASSVCLMSLLTQRRSIISSSIDIQCIVYIQEDTKGEKYSCIYNAPHAQFCCNKQKASSSELAMQNNLHKNVDTIVRGHNTLTDRDQKNIILDYSHITTDCVQRCGELGLEHAPRARSKAPCQ